jgi:hypothetical protein
VLGKASQSRKMLFRTIDKSRLLFVDLAFELDLIRLVGVSNNTSVGASWQTIAQNDRYRFDNLNFE